MSEVTQIKTNHWAYKFMFPPNFNMFLEDKCLQFGYSTWLRLDPEDFYFQ